jgi:putative heme-binding domain-containing protein
MIDKIFSFLLISACALQAESPTPLFNGTDLEGWDGDPRLWRVEDGVIVGETDDGDRKIQSNSFLIWQGGELGDFDLTFKARVEGNNSGMQYRSERFGEEGWRMKGYQFDLHPSQAYLGMLYEEGGRGIVCQRGQRVKLTAGRKPAEVGKLAVEPTELKEWQSYRIVARGHHLRHFVNGRLAAHITDTDEAKRSLGGKIGLQLHAGPAMRAEFKDIELRPVTEEAVGARGPVIAWIWSGARAKAGEKAFFRREFQVPAAMESAELTVAADDSYRVWINGEEVGEGGDWSVAATYRIDQWLEAGATNVVAIEARNREAAAGMALRLRMTDGGGKDRFVVSNGEWSVSSETADGWRKRGFESADWGPATLVGEMGDDPWGMVISEVRAAGEPVPDVVMPPGFEVRKIYQVAADQGSWVSMTVDDRGRLICSDQYGGIYSVEVGSGGAVGRVSRLDIPLTGSQGVLWFEGSLYVSINHSKKGEQGVYRVRREADGWAEPERLMSLRGQGEHGPHSLVASPDGEWIYFCSGNHTNLPEVEYSHVPRVWDEDQLLPRRPDARGHANNRMAPGGWVIRFRPDGGRRELISIGYRNQYDLAFNARGDLFTYDADMEWDLGMPWYRPTRICRVLAGSEFGWRHGTGKWPEYYEDSMPSTHDIGPGSPTGLISGRGARFPAKYQRALFAFDWTFATIYAIHLEPDGIGYRAQREEFLAGKGLPLTSAAIGDDGAMYFLTGGRRTDSALWRVTYRGGEPTDPVEYAAAIREVAADDLASDDRLERYVARTALERDGDIAGALAAAKEPWAVIQAAMAGARRDAERHREAGIGALLALDWEALHHQQKITWLRALGLYFIRSGEPSNAEREKVLAKIDPAFPDSEREVNYELCRMLSDLQAPGVVARTLNLMDASGPAVAPDWLELASRNDRYGSAIEKMIESLPPTHVIHYIYCLRVVEGPWQRSERERFFDWLDRLERRSGGASYAGFIKGLREDTLASATPEERAWLEQREDVEVFDPFADLPKVEGPGRAWTIDEVEAVAAAGLEDADRENGERMFRATLCAACHVVDGPGGAAGPSLATLAGRFTARDLAAAIIEPSAEVSDQYAFDSLKLDNGDQVIGRVLDEKDEHLIVAVNPFDFSRTVEVERGRIAERETSPVSPMPGGLINSLNREELRDLLGYLLGSED